MIHYNFTPEEVLQNLHTTTQGLDNNEVVNRQKQYGKNKLPEHKKAGILVIFFQQFLNPLIYVLLFAAGVSLFLKEYTDAVFIFAVLLLNALIGTIQEYNAEKSAAALQSMVKVLTKVRRGGSVITVDSEELVPGDIVLLESGNKVPADLRLIEVNELKVDEAFLTGESEGIFKTLDALSGELVVGDRKNMVYAGSIVLYGRGVGVVTGTAANTEMGKIADTIGTTESFKAPLVIRMEKFAKQVAYIILVLIGILAVVTYLQGMEINEIFFLSIALAVSAIPEGLPVAITVALSISTARMTRRNVIVRKLSAVEGLGSCTIIASDKTGTLTVNSQTVQKVILPNGNHVDISGEGYNDQGTCVFSDKTTDNEQAFYDFVEATVMCNESELYLDNGEWKMSGDSVDVAFKALAYKQGTAPTDIKNKYVVLAELPFESEKKYAATFYKANNTVYVAVKGALETISAMSSEIHENEVEKQAISLTTEGFRVIAVALGIVPESEQFTEASIQNLRFLGLAGLKDPLRPEAQKAVQECLNAGVSVAMVTGDHPLTALSIAKDLGIATSIENVITGVQITEAVETKGLRLANVIEHKTVFARVSPLQKMHIVEALSELGHLVAVTGDGVNDVPALKKANIGIAMGSGTDLAKETAEIIVTDDNFKSIEDGIEGGRHAYDNIRKVTYLLISTGAAEIVLFMLAIFFNLKDEAGKFLLPLTAIQLLWLNLVTNGVQHVALAFEGPEADLMKRKPRNPKEGIFNKYMIQQTVLSGLTMGIMAFVLFYLAYYSFDYMQILNPEQKLLHAQSLVFTMMVILENVHVFNCRSEYTSAFRMSFSRNWFILFGVLTAQLIHIVAINIPVMQGVLGTNAISLHEWSYMVMYALILLMVMEVFKIVQRKKS